MENALQLSGGTTFSSLPRRGGGGGGGGGSGASRARQSFKGFELYRANKDDITYMTDLNNGPKFSFSLIISSAPIRAP